MKYKEFQVKGLVFFLVKATKILFQREMVNSVNYISSLEIMAKPEIPSYFVLGFVFPCIVFQHNVLFYFKTLGNIHDACGRVSKKTTGTYI